VDDSPTGGLEVASLAVLRERQSAKWRTYPADVLPLTVAEMDVDLAPPIAAVLHDVVDRSDTGYAFPAPALGEAVAAFAARRWSWDIDPSAVRAMTDVGAAVVEMLRLLTGPGDAVVISPPVYPPFFDWVPEAGARLVEVPLRHDVDLGWRLDLAGLERAFAARPAAYILCNPHNPVGRVHTADELAELVRLAHAYDVRLISDEIHGPLVLPGATFTPLLTVPGAAEIAVSMLSASKAWNLAGLKCAGIVTASTAMADVVDRLPPDTRWRVGHFGVLATVAAFTAAEDWLDRLLVTLDARRALLGSLLRDRLPTLSWHPPEATYLAWLNCAAVGPGNEARDLFLERAKVAVEPGLSFGAAGGGHIRVNYATSAEILEAATNQMRRALG
jgi:cysteine-S-conjugate beta-lyase